MFPSGSVAATSVVVVKILFRTARASTEVSVERLVIAAMRSFGLSANRAVRKLANWYLRALRTGSTSGSIDANSGASCAAFGRRAIEATADSRRVRLGSINWNCTKAVPIKRRTPPLGFNCVNSSLAPDDRACVSISIRANRPPETSPMKNTPSLRSQTFLSDHCSRNVVTWGRSDAAIASSASLTVPRDGLEISVV